MPNMSYCRLNNTASDLQDCLDHIEDKLSKEEHKRRDDLIGICEEIVDVSKRGRIPEETEE